MTSKLASILAFVFAALGLLYLYNKHYLFSKNPISITIQVFAVILTIWSRITFGLRSFHAGANTTRGKLVTTGPYHLWRHPIYASIIYFAWACMISYPYIETVAAVIFITLSLFARMLLEEKSLLNTYGDKYAEHAKRTKRFIPYLL